MGAILKLKDKDGNVYTIPAIQGPQGEPGKDGAPGKDGVDGAPGKDGVDGAPGKDGTNGKDGVDGAPGKDGEPGAPGVSASHVWNGTTLTITSASGTSSADLKGDPGKSAYEIAKENGATEESEAEWLEANKSYNAKMEWTGDTGITSGKGTLSAEDFISGGIYVFMFINTTAKVVSSGVLIYNSSFTVSEGTAGTIDVSISPQSDGSMNVSVSPNSTTASASDINGVLIFYKIGRI